MSCHLYFLSFTLLPLSLYLRFTSVSALSECPQSAVQAPLRSTTLHKAAIFSNFFWSQLWNEYWSRASCRDEHGRVFLAPKAGVQTTKGFTSCHTPISLGCRPLQTAELPRALFLKSCFILKLKNVYFSIVIFWNYYIK